MALSKYERKVLAEFEAELAQPTRRLRRVRQALAAARRRLWRWEGRVGWMVIPILVLLAGAGACAAAIAVVSPRGTPYVTSLIGLGTGLLASAAWCRAVRRRG